MRKLSVLLGALGMLVLPSVLLAEDSVSDWETGSGLDATGKASFGPDVQASLPTFIGRYIIAPVFGILGTIFFALMVYAGVLWMTAAGDPKRVDKAKAILTSSVIGAVIVASAYVITNAVFSGITTGAIT